MLLGEPRVSENGWRVIWLQLTSITSCINTLLYKQKHIQEQLILPKIEEYDTGVRQDSLHFNWACYNSDELARNKPKQQKHTNKTYNHGY